MRIYLSLREDASTGNPNGEQFLSVKIYDAMGVDADGNFFDLGAKSDVILGKDLNFDSTLTDVAEKLNNELIALQLKETEAAKKELETEVNEKNNRIKSLVHSINEKNVLLDDLSKEAIFSEKKGVLKKNKVIQLQFPEKIFLFL